MLTIRRILARTDAAGSHRSGPRHRLQREGTGRRLTQALGTKLNGTLRAI